RLSGARRFGASRRGEPFWRLRRSTDQERMMDTPSLDPNDMPERLPEALRSRLEAADRPAVPADPEVDAAVLRDARAYFAARTGAAADVGRRRRAAGGAADARPRRSWRPRVRQ